MIDFPRMAGALSRQIGRGLRLLWTLPACFAFAYSLSVALLGAVAGSTGSPLAGAAVAIAALLGLLQISLFCRVSNQVHGIVEQVKRGDFSRLEQKKTRDLVRLGRPGYDLQDLVRSLMATRENLVQSSLETVKTIALALEARDAYTQGHCLRVRYLVRRILDRLDVTAEFRTLTETAALLHDVGKIGVPDALLLKKGALSRDEYARIMLHVEVGVEILQPLSSMREVATIVKHHHERYDGTGYPDGLKGEAIPLASRIIAVADTIDAMRSTRPYRPALSLQSILEELVLIRGTQLDPHLANIAVSVLQPSLRRRPAFSLAGLATRRLERPVAPPAEATEEERSAEGVLEVS